MKKNNTKVEFNWTPGHANIMRNETADRPAKTAAEEAEAMSEQTTPATHLDIRNVVRISCLVKWQKRWNAGNTGRDMYNLKPSATTRSKPTANIQVQKTVTQSITG